MTRSPYWFSVWVNFDALDEPVKFKLDYTDKWLPTPFVNRTFWAGEETWVDGLDRAFEAVEHWLRDQGYGEVQ